MPRPTSFRSRLVAGIVGGAAALGLLPGTTGPALAFPAASVQLTGHGWGHGRGMGQWGADGYAQAGWSATQILDHYYSNTTAGSVDPNADMAVRLTQFDGGDLTSAQEKGHLQVSQGGTVVVGPNGSGLAVQIHRNGANSFRVSTAPNCGGPWTVVRDGLPSPVVVAPTAPSDDHSDLLQACEPDGARWVRGQLWAVERSEERRVGKECRSRWSPYH